MKEFFKGIFSSGTPESSKRFFGAVGFVYCLFYNWIGSLGLTETILYLSCLLIGLEQITTIFNNKQNGKTK